MELGVFAQLFVPKFERDVDPNAEHKRIMRNVEIAKAADQNAFIVAGAPDDCALGVQKWVDEGFDQLTFSPTTNPLPTEVVVQSMELFGREVIPQFDKDPVHSTTRYREAASR